MNQPTNRNTLTGIENRLVVDKGGVKWDGWVWGRCKLFDLER